MLNAWIVKVCSNGWISFGEAGMNSCVGGHTFCTKHAPEWELTWQDKKKEVLGDWYLRNNKLLLAAVRSAETEEEFNALVAEHGLGDSWEEAESGYDVPARACPICSFGKVHERDAFLYLLKVAGRTETDLLAELREKFATYGEMKQWLKE